MKGAERTTHRRHAGYVLGSNFLSTDVSVTLLPRTDTCLAIDHTFPLICIGWGVMFQGLLSHEFLLQSYTSLAYLAS
jgi:hypothetical protein